MSVASRSVYGPQGNRPAHPSNLTTEDIEGAQASTLRSFPKGTLRNARSTRATGAAIIRSMPGTPRGATIERMEQTSGEEALQATLRPEVADLTLRLEADVGQTTLPPETARSTFRFGADAACIPAERG